MRETNDVSISGSGDCGMINKGKPKFSLQSLTGHQYPHQLTAGVLGHCNLNFTAVGATVSTRSSCETEDPAGGWKDSLFFSGVSFRLAKIAPKSADLMLQFKYFQYPVASNCCIMDFSHCLSQSHCYVLTSPNFSLCAVVKKLMCAGGKISIQWLVPSFDLLAIMRETNPVNWEWGQAAQTAVC